MRIDFNPATDSTYECATCNGRIRAWLRDRRRRLAGQRVGGVEERRDAGSELRLMDTDLAFFEGRRRFDDADGQTSKRKYGFTAHRRCNTLFSSSFFSSFPFLHHCTTSIGKPTTGKRAVAMHSLTYLYLAGLTRRFPIINIIIFLHNIIPQASPQVPPKSILTNIVFK